MSLRLPRGVPVASAALLALAVAAPAAHAERGVPVGPVLAGEVADVSADGRTVALTGASNRLLVTTLTADGTPGTPVDAGRIADSGALIGAGVDGSAFVATLAPGNGSLLGALRPAGAAFGTLAPVTTDRNGSAVSDVATLGGLTLLGTDLAAGGDGGQPAVLRRAADGTVAAPVVLPATPGFEGESSEVRVGIDAAGRGVVTWLTGVGASRHTAIATLAADGTLGPIGALPGTVKSNLESNVDLRVAPDGTGAVAWRQNDKIAVAPVSTTTGVDPTAPATVTLRGDVAVQADGAAVVVRNTRDKVRKGRKIVVASRAAGGAFTAPTDVPGVANGRQSVAISGGHWVAAQDTLADDVERATAEHGAAGGAPSKAVPLAVGAATNADVTAVAPGGTPIVLVESLRETYSGSSKAKLRRNQAFRIAPGSPRPAAVTLKTARTQRLGRPQAFRGTLKCSSACSYRIFSDVVQVGKRNGSFDVARTAAKGTHRITAAFPGVSETETSKSFPLRTAKRVRFTIVVDDARGGQTIFHRRVTLRP